MSQPECTVFVDEACGTAVLRGAHVYASGIIGAPACAPSLNSILIVITCVVFRAIELLALALFSSPSRRRGVRIRGVGARQEGPEGTRDVHGAACVRRRRRVARRSRHFIHTRRASCQVSRRCPAVHSLQYPLHIPTVHPQFTVHSIQYSLCSLLTVHWPVGSACA